MKSRETIGITAAVAAAAFGAQFVAEAVQPVAKSKVCSDIGTNYCPPEAVGQKDVTEPELERAVIERARVEQAPPPPGPVSLTPGTANMSVQGYAPGVRIDPFDETGMPGTTPLPLRSPPPTTTLTS